MSTHLIHTISYVMSAAPTHFAVPTSTAAPALPAAPTAIERPTMNSSTWNSVAIDFHPGDPVGKGKGIIRHDVSSNSPACVTMFRSSLEY